MFTQFAVAFILVLLYCRLVTFSVKMTVVLPFLLVVVTFFYQLYSLDRLTANYETVS